MLELLKIQMRLLGDIMYLLINSDKMAILAYSNNYEYLWELGCALCKDCAHVVPADNSLMEYSPEDIQRFYINLTGDLHGCVSNSSKVLGITLNLLAKHNQVLPSANVTSNFAQVAIDKNIEFMHIENGKIKDGFKCIKVSLSEEDKVTYLRDMYCDVLNGNFKPEFTVTNEPVINVVTHSTSTTPTASRMTGSRQLIWDVATTMWIDAGSPTNKSEVLSLRKLIMNELEKQGVNRNSASNELGKWHKETAPF